MTDWREVGNRLLGAPADLKAIFGLKVGLTPAEAVRELLKKAPELAGEIDTDGIDEDIAAWRTLRRDQAAQPALDKKAGNVDTAYRAAKFILQPGQLTLQPARALGVLGDEETPGSMVRDAVGGKLGSFAGGATDALIDPFTMAAVAGTGGGSVAATELLKKVGELALAGQAAKIGMTGAEKGFTSPEFQDEAAGAAGGLLAGIGLPTAVGAVRARLRPPAPALPPRQPAPPATAAPAVAPPENPLVALLDQADPGLAEAVAAIRANIESAGAAPSAPKIPTATNPLLSLLSDSELAQYYNRPDPGAAPSAPNTGTASAPGAGRNLSGFALPKDLSGSTPRYSYGAKGFMLNFESDLDKALYILAQKNPSKADARFLEAVVNHTGMSEAEARAAGAGVRDRIKSMARGAEPGTLTIRAAQAPRPATALAQEPVATPPEAPPVATRPSAAAVKAATALKQAEDHYQGAQEALRYQERQGLSTGRELTILSAAAKKLEDAKAAAAAVAKSEGIENLALLAQVPERSSTSQKAEAALKRAETQLKAAEWAAEYKKKRGENSVEATELLRKASERFKKAQERASAVNEFESMDPDLASWVDTVVQSQIQEGATTIRPGDDVLKVFRQNATAAALRESGLEGVGKSEKGLTGKRFEDSGWAVEQALGLPVAKSYSEDVQNGMIADAAIQAGRTGATTVLTPDAIERGVAGLPYRERAAGAGFDIDALVRLHLLRKAGGTLTPDQMARYVAAAKAAKEIDLGRGFTETHTFDDHVASRAAMQRAAAEDVTNLDAEPVEFSHARSKRTGGAGPPRAPREAPVEEPIPQGPPDEPVNLMAGPRTKSIERRAPPRVPDGGGIVGALKRGKQAAGDAADIFRSVAGGTIRNVLAREGYPTVARVLDKVGAHQKYDSADARVAFDTLRAMGYSTDEAVAGMYQRVTSGTATAKDIEANRIRQAIQDSQYNWAERKDPPRGDPDTETIAGVAPREGPDYWPHGFEVPGPPKVHQKSDRFRPLSTVANHKAPNLYKERVGDLGQPVLKIDDLEAIALKGARSVGALKGAVTNPSRSPEAYPRAYKALVQKFTDEGVADPEGAARGRLSEEQFPDIREAAFADLEASGRPASWSDVENNALVARAVDEVVKGTPSMSEAARNVTGKVGTVTRALQLMTAGPRNLVGLGYIPGLAYDAVTGSGGSRVRGLAAAAKASAIGAGSFARSTAQDVGLAVGRKLGATDRLSDAQKLTGRSRMGANLTMRSIAFMDRNAQLAVARALREYIPQMRHDQFRYVDHSLPMSHPSNIRAAQREMAEDSQGIGTAADKFMASGVQPGMDTLRDLAHYYMSPELRQYEKGAARLSFPAKLLTYGPGMLVAGELANTASSVMKGGGPNIGQEPTEDQKRFPLRSIISTTRDPRPFERAMQDIVAGLPFGKQVLQSKEYGDVPFLGTAPAAALAINVGKAFAQAKKTGDARALLAIINAPGFGKSWSRIVAFDAAQKKNSASGLGGVPQDFDWPWKINEYLNGRMTIEEALSDERSVLEKRANRHREQQNEASDKRAKRGGK